MIPKWSEWSETQSHPDVRGPQKDERERIQIQKTADTLEDLESRLEGWATEIEAKVVEGTSRAAPPDRSPDIISRIQASEAKLAERLDKLEQGLEGHFAEGSRQETVHGLLSEVYK